MCPGFSGVGLLDDRQSSDPRRKVAFQTPSMAGARTRSADEGANLARAEVLVQHSTLGRLDRWSDQIPRPGHRDAPGPQELIGGWVAVAPASRDVGVRLAT